MGQKGKLYLWPRNLAMHVIMEIIALILLMPASLHIRRMGGCVCTLPCGSIIWSAFHITLFCPLILVLLVLCRSPLQSFPLSSPLLEWHFQLSESTPTPPLFNLSLSSFLHSHLTFPPNRFRQMGKLWKLRSDELQNILPRSTSRLPP